jgi:hypothetical protein
VVIFMPAHEGQTIKLGKSESKYASVDGAVAELTQLADGTVVAQIRIPGPARP